MNEIPERRMVCYYCRKSRPMKELVKVSNSNYKCIYCIDKLKRIMEDRKREV